MTVITKLTIGAAVVLAAIGPAAVAHAEPAPFNGTYTGGDAQNYWTVTTNCPTDGCTGTVASNQGWTVPTTMRGGVWNFVVTKPDGVICADGSYAPAYITFAVDPTTLRGTITNDSNYSCPGGQVTTNPFTLTKVA